ncbi:MAG: radical SAM protein [Candidatus Eisenbacteria bacterium]|uniref:Radical SAM protein n=1 Tax=Eiseniibacteriota bacterium TaxID=2212470 RepID=A0A849SDN9_UNCEI|nr:radical SAM protein [Candidatus Eisenbacteria bacterium]
MQIEYREEPCRSALNRVVGMGFEWSLNPYMGCAHRCAFCYVRQFERRAERPSGETYGLSIRVKTNIAQVLRTELARPSWKREQVAIGAATDPYQPIEGQYRLTRACLIELSRARTPFGIITRGPLIVRDLDVLTEAAKRVKVGVSISIPTLDEAVCRTLEPGAPPPRARLEAVRRLVDAGIRAGIGMAPILPGLSDAPEQLAAVVRAAREVGAVSLWAGVVYLKDAPREHFLDALRREWPEQLAYYEKLFASRSYLPRRLTAPIVEKVRELKLLHDIADRRTLRLEPAPEPGQLLLGV